MISFLKKRLWYFSIFLLVVSCTNKKNDINLLKLYSISLGSFKSYEKAIQFKSTLSNKVRANLRLEYISKKNYKLLYGKYGNSLITGKRAYELFCDSLISSYEICRNGQRVLDEFCNIPFVGNLVETPCLFNYNILSRNFELLWSKKEEKVISYNLSQNADAAFIITASFNGKVGGLPVIKNSNIYFMNRIQDDVQQLDELGDGYQLYTYWDTADSFRVNITFTDTNNPRIIHQKIRTWDASGRKIKSFERSFDILKQGFPSPPNRKPRLISPNQNLELRLVPNANQVFFYLKNYQEKSEVLIGSSHEMIKDVRWDDDSNAIFIVTENKPLNEKKSVGSRDKILIVNTMKRKISRIIEGQGFRNLLVRGKLLFFDEHFKEQQRISIYDYQLNKYFGKIYMPGGCALNTLTN